MNPNNNNANNFRLVCKRNVNDNGGYPGDPYGFGLYQAAAAAGAAGTGAYQFLPSPPRHFNYSTNNTNYSMFTNNTNNIYNFSNANNFGNNSNYNNNGHNNISRNIFPNLANPGVQWLTMGDDEKEEEGGDRLAEELLLEEQQQQQQHFINLDDNIEVPRRSSTRNPSSSSSQGILGSEHFFPLAKSAELLVADFEPETEVQQQQLQQQQQQQHQQQRRPSQLQQRRRSSGASSILSNGEHHFSFKEQLYKTELCRNMTELGVCEFGDDCYFAHSEAEKRQAEGRRLHPNHRTVHCIEWNRGNVCKFGRRCAFIHRPPRTSFSLSSSAGSNGEGNGGSSSSKPALSTALWDALLSCGEFEPRIFEDSSEH